MIPGWRLGLPAALDSAFTVTVGAVESISTATTATGGGVSVAAILLTIWAIGVLVLMARLIVGFAGLRLLVAAAAPLTDTTMLARVSAAELQLQLNSALRCFVSDSLRVPIVGGLRRPVLVLPETSQNWSESRLQMVVSHELAHLRRRDPLWSLLAAVVAAIWWFLPPVWLLKSALHHDSELACDDVVLAGGVAPPEYAWQVLQIAREANRTREVKLGLAFARQSQLEGRVMSILKERKRPATESGRLRIAITVLALAIALPLTGLSLQSCSEAPEAETDTASGTPEGTVAPTTPAEPTATEADTEFVAVDTPPEMVSAQAPEYPESAKQQGIEGTVYIRAFVDATGTVTQAEVLKSSEFELLDTAAVEAAWKNQFKPAQKNGLAAGVWITYPVTFKLD